MIIKKFEEKEINSNNCNVKIVSSEDEIISLTEKGYDCQTIGENKWLMKKIETSYN